MRSFAQRLRRLEEALGPKPETEHVRRLLGRIEAGRKRVAQLNRPGFPPPEPPTPERLAWLKGKSVVEILDSGRQRVYEAEMRRLAQADEGEIEGAKPD